MFFQLRLSIVLDYFINGFKLAVSLRMVDWREAFLYSKFAAEFSEFLAVELHPIVWNDLVKYAKSAYYSLPYEILNFLTWDRGQWFRFCPFCEIVDSNHAYLNAGCVVGIGPIRSIPHIAKDHGDVMEASFSGCYLGMFENLCSLSHFFTKVIASFLNVGQ